MIYSILPMLLALLSPLGLLGNRSIQLYTSLFLMLFFALFCGLRWYSGADYSSYVDIFHAVPTFDGFSGESVEYIHGELGYKWLNSFFKTIGFSYYFSFFIVAILSIYFKFHLYRKLGYNIFFCCAYYLALNFYSGEYIQIRMGLGVGILALAVLSYRDDKLYRCFFYILLATSIHSVCALFFIVFLLRFINLKTLLFFSFLFPIVFTFVPFLRAVLDVLMAVTNMPILTVLYNYAHGGVYGNPVGITNLTPARHLLITVLLIISYKNIRAENFKTLELVKIYVAGCALTSLFMDIELLYSRAVFLFDIIEPVVLCVLLSSIKDYRTRAFCFLCLIIAPLLLMVRSSLTNNNLYDYDTWLKLIV